MTPLENSQIGEYEVRGLLGKGGMGEVYEGLQPLIGKRVAIKVLQAEAAARADVAQRFLAEARAVNAIGHRGIVDIFSFGTLPDGRHYFVMELLPGEPLNKYLKQNAPLPALEVCELLDELLDALGAAHAVGIVHRDLKPSNLFLVMQSNGTRYLKLLDFGIAKLRTPEGHNPLTQPHMVLGTPQYMAPEQIAGMAIPASDLYSVGCIGWAMLVGRPPFTGANALDIFEQHQRAPVPAVRTTRPDVPQALESLVMQLMAKVPTDRPASAQVARAELRRLRDGLLAVRTDRSRTALNMEVLATPPPVPSPVSAAAPVISVDVGQTTAISMTPAPAVVFGPPAAKTEPMDAVVVPAALSELLPLAPLTPAVSPRSERGRLIALGVGVALAAGLAFVLWPRAEVVVPPARVVVVPPAAAPPVPVVVEAPKLTREKLSARIALLRKRPANLAAMKMLGFVETDLGKPGADLEAIAADLDDWDQKHPPR